MKNPARLRPLLVFVLLTGATPALAAQVEFGPMVGVHFDRSEQIERRISYRVTPHLIPDDAWQVNAPGTVASFGARVGLALDPRARIEVRFMYSHNKEWTYLLLNPGLAVADRHVDSSFATTKLYLLPRLQFDLLPGRAFTLRLGAGPSIVSRSGSGENALVNSTTVGGNFGLQAVRFLGPHVGLALDADLLVYTGRLKQAFSFQSGPQGTSTHKDLVLSVSMLYRVGRQVASGTSHGPGFTPRPPAPE